MTSIVYYQDSHKEITVSLKRVLATKSPLPRPWRRLQAIALSHIHYPKRYGVSRACSCDERQDEHRDDRTSDRKGFHYSQWKFFTK